MIMFLVTKHAADRLTSRRAPARFRSGRTPVLVATSVAARGIHVDGLDLVVNVGQPACQKEYLHHGGRNARAGGTGSVVIVVTPNQRRSTTRLMAEAGNHPRTTRIRPGAPELHRITGARTPAGIPVHGTEPRDRPARGYGPAHPARPPLTDGTPDRSVALPARPGLLEPSAPGPTPLQTPRRSRV